MDNLITNVMLLVLAPIWLAVLIIACLIAAPVLIPLWLLEKWRNRGIVCWLTPSPC